MNILLIFYGGLFVQNESGIPSWIEWPKEISFYNHAFEILMVNEFSGLTFQMRNASVIIEGYAINSGNANVTMTGDFFLTFFGMKKDDVDGDYLGLFYSLMVYFFMAFIALEFLYRSRN